MNHRFTLERRWIGSGRLVNWIMLNPSTADDVFDDATIRKCIGFGKRWGFSRLVVTNLFAYRATLPDDLLKLWRTDPQIAIGEYRDGSQRNNAHIAEWAAKADVVVCAWGNVAPLLVPRELEVLKILNGYPLHCIRLTKSLGPAHPVREPYTDSPLIYREACVAA